MAFPTFPEGFACKQWHFQLSGEALHANNGIFNFPGRLCVQTMAFPAFREGFACKQWHFRLSGKALRANNGISDFPEKALRASNGNLKIYDMLLSADSHHFSFSDTPNTGVEGYFGRANIIFP
jgi:hypothetical protein